MKTGKIRLRNSIFGKLILQVEERNSVWSHKEQYTWKDAKVADLSRGFGAAEIENAKQKGGDLE